MSSAPPEAVLGPTMVTISVHILEVRDVPPKDSSGLSDPYVRVTIAGGLAQRKTAIAHQQTSAVYDEQYVFPDLCLSPDDYARGQIKFEVYDANIVFRDELIGQFAFQIRKVREQPTHQFFRTWVVLAHPDTPMSGQGYLRVTVTVLGPGDSPPSHTMRPKEMTIEELRSATKFGAEAKNVLHAPAGTNNKRRDYNFEIKVIKAEYLTEQCDSFMVVRFNGVYCRTPVKRVSAAPDWGYKLTMPVHSPLYSEIVEIELWKEVGLARPDELIASHSMSFSQILANQYPPTWFNFYGPRPDEASGFMAWWNQSVTKRGKLESTHYLGRALLAMSAGLTQFPCREEAPCRPVVAGPTRKYHVRVDLYKAAELLELSAGSTVFVEVNFGPKDNTRVSSEVLVTKQLGADFSSPDSPNCCRFDVIEMILPEVTPDQPARVTSQLPDIIVSLFTKSMIGSVSRVGLIRMKPIDVWGFKNDPEWHALKGPIDDSTGFSKSQGFLLMGLGFGTKEEEPAKRRVYEDIDGKRGIFQLRAYVYQARGLPSTDSASGLTSTYVKVSLANSPALLVQTQPARASEILAGANATAPTPLERTTVCENTTSPVWYETLVLDSIVLPAGRNLALAPDIIVSLYASPSNELIGTTRFPAELATTMFWPKRARPRWLRLARHDFTRLRFDRSTMETYSALSKGNSVAMQEAASGLLSVVKNTPKGDYFAGELLIKLELMPIARARRRPWYTRHEWPPVQPCKIQLLTLGLRQLSTSLTSLSDLAVQVSVPSIPDCNTLIREAREDAQRMTLVTPTNQTARPSKGSLTAVEFEDGGSPVLGGGYYDSTHQDYDAIETDEDDPDEGKEQDDSNTEDDDEEDFEKPFDEDEEDGPADPEAPPPRRRAGRADLMFDPGVQPFQVSMERALFLNLKRKQLQPLPYDERGTSVWRSTVEDSDEERPETSDAESNLIKALPHEEGLTFLRVVELPVNFPRDSFYAPLMTVVLTSREGKAFMGSAQLSLQQFALDVYPELASVLSAQLVPAPDGSLRPSAHTVGKLVEEAFLLPKHAMTRDGKDRFEAMARRDSLMTASTISLAPSVAGETDDGLSIASAVRPGEPEDEENIVEYSDEDDVDDEDQHDDDATGTFGPRQMFVHGEGQGEELPYSIEMDMHAVNVVFDAELNNKGGPVTAGNVRLAPVRRVKAYAAKRTDPAVAAAPGGLNSTEPETLDHPNITDPIPDEEDTERLAIEDDYSNVQWPKVKVESLGEDAVPETLEQSQFVTPLPYSRIEISKGATYKGEMMEMIGVLKTGILIVPSKGDAPMLVSRRANERELGIDKRLRVMVDSAATVTEEEDAAPERPGYEKKQDSDPSSTVPGLTCLPRAGPQHVKVRVYIVQATDLWSANPDAVYPYVVASMMLPKRSQEGWKLVDSVSDAHNLKSGASPFFGAVYELDARFPDVSVLDITIWDRPMAGGAVDRVIGSTRVDLEDRWFNPLWQSMKRRKRFIREFRPLLDPVAWTRPDVGGGRRLQPRGKVEMWIEMYTPQEAVEASIVDIRAPQREEWELRAVVWETRNVPPPENSTTMSVYVTGELSMKDPDTGQWVADQTHSTDTHYGASAIGMFNWRMKFNLQVPARFPRLTMKVWSTEWLSIFPDQAVGIAVVDLDFLEALVSANRNEDKPIERPRTLIKFTHENGIPRGELDLQLTLVKAQDALADPVGNGREPPNKDPFLMEPKRDTGWKGLFSGISVYRVCCCLIFIAIIVIVVIIVVQQLA